MNVPIRFKLTLWYTLSLAGLLLVFGVAIDQLMWQSFVARSDFELDEEMDEFVFEFSRDMALPDALKELELRFASHESFEFLIFDHIRRKVFSSDGIDQLDSPLGMIDAISERRYFTQSLPQLGLSRVVTQKIEVDGNDYLVQVIRTLRSSIEELVMLRRLMVSIGPILLIISAIGGYQLAWRSLRPVDQMTKTALLISASDLARRIAADNPDDELGRLATAFNQMLSRLQKSFEDLRQFTADAAHEFRTPLSVIRSAAEIALDSDRSSEYYQETLQSIVEETNRLSRMSNQLLMLAREDARLDEFQFSSVELRELVCHVANDLGPLAEEKQIEIICDLPEDAKILGDTSRLRRVFVNLFDNAIKYSPETSKIRVVQSASQSYQKIVIMNESRVISSEHLEKLFDRFYRVESSRTRESGGAGLGLSICKSIVERHGGQISVSSSTGEPFAVTVALPTAI